jgi:acetylglutamate kinase
MSLTPYIAKAETLIEALPYIQSFRGATVVVKFGGSAMEDREHMASILLDVAFMWTVGMCPVIVHGGGKAISRALERAGVPTQFVQGLRVTCADAIKVVEQVIKHEVNAEVVSLLRSHGAQAEALFGDRIFHVHRKTGKDLQTGAPLDWGFVGEPVACDTGPVLEMLHRGVVPVVCPLGTGDDLKLYNINADNAAAALAKALRARKLAFVSDVPGLLRDPKDPSTLIQTLKVEDAPALVRDGVVGGGMLPKIQSCIDAIQAGVGKVHMVDGRMAHSLLLEIFTRTGVGTEIIGP